ncbi:MAG: HEAT repeat domain-containing protein [Desulfomonile sp.]|nr:HEAT repeat domain-containing protein [Desulfomonile sp.]
MDRSSPVTNRDVIWVWVGYIALLLGILALLYIAYDLKYPNHFVGDMYSLEVMFRLVVLSSAAGPMLIGAVLFFLGRHKNVRRWLTLGTTVTTVSSTILIAMSIGVAHSRHMDEVRKTYPQKSVEELLAIAKGEKDQHAVDQLIIRADPAAVPGLASIVTDDKEPGYLRYVAAEALARIGNDDARMVLEKARDSCKDAWFKEILSRLVDDVTHKR